MEYFAPGLRELPRIAARCIYRGRLLMARRRLAAAETELGLLGWQQADFDESTERQVDEIQHVEREQARLHNASAELAQHIIALNAERTRLREEHEAERSRIEPGRDQLRAALGEIETRLAALRKFEPERDRRVAEIEREQGKLEKRHAELLEVEPQTPQIRDDLIRLRDRQLALSDEMADLQNQHQRNAADLEVNERELAELELHLYTLDQQFDELAAAAAAADAKLADELREREKEKARLAADAENLEKAKLDPYREIGRVLADSGVAPVNQPQGLERVLTLRAAIEQYAAATAALRARTAQEDRSQLHISLALLAVIAIALALFIGALF